MNLILVNDVIGKLRSESRRTSAGRRARTVGVLMLACVLSPGAQAESTLVEALKGGKVNMLFNYRFELVDDDSPQHLEDAHAQTLRTVLGYQTGLFHGFGVQIDLEDVAGIETDYNDGSNRKPQFAVVVDPIQLDLLNALLRYEGVQNTVLKLGRQVIAHRPEPWNRFVGPVVWRQKWQTFDGLTVINTSLPDTEASFSYVVDVHRVFGEDNPIPDRADAELNGYFMRGVYSGFAPGKIESYAYLLDYDHTASLPFSSQTYGARFDGTRALTAPLTAVYAVEYAHQWDFGDNPNEVDEHYVLGEGGLSYAVGKILESVTFKLSYELLSGDGGVGAGFQTPLATLHPYQGWADKFLQTPPDGVQDAYVTLGVNVLGASFSAIYHDFESDHDHYDYGTEWDVALTRTFQKRLTLGIKYAVYSADSNPLNQARSPTQSSDINKVWAWATFKY